MLALMVNVQIKPGMRSEFLAVIKEDAENTSAKEEGNFQFTVIQNNDDPDSFFFLEVYKDQAALDAHRTMPHFLKYREATADIYVSDPVRAFGTNVFPDDSYWMS
jgi:quinol monooxygenase YgiN